jgi:hypothetical protein
MTEENTNLEAVGTQPTTKRRSRKSAAPRTAAKRAARKPRVSENGITPPTEEVVGE